MAGNPDEMWLSALDGQPRHHAGEIQGAGTEQAVDEFPRPTDAFAEPPPPFGWTDGLTELGGPRIWTRVLASEQARNTRHARTSTIVLLEVTGFGTAAKRWGPAIALRQFVELSHMLTDVVRQSDHCVRIAPTRFAVLLTETDEISAINFVDRVTTRCAKNIDATENCLRVVAGGASPEVGGRLADAVEVEQQRLEAELAREA